MVRLGLGLGEHSGRYANLIDAFAEDGISFIGLDARGHGRSDGKRGDATITKLVNDLEEFLLLIRERYQVRRPMLLGHSMGGAVVISFALRHSNQWEISHLITSGAGLRPHLDAAQKIKMAGGKLLNLLSPTLTLPTGLPASGLSHDRSVIRAYENDPLVHDQISARLAVSLIEAGEEAIERAGILKIPCLILHGGSDPIVDPGGSEDFYQNVSSQDRQCKVYPNLYHEIFNESPPDRRRVLSDLRKWVLERI